MVDTEKTYLGSGPLNALVIAKGRGNTGLIAVIASAVEGENSTPGPAERTLKASQERVTSDVAARAVKVGQEACQATDATLQFATRRMGDAEESLGVDFTCSRPEDAEGQCCRIGLLAAVQTLNEYAVQAREAVLEQPLAGLQQ